MRSLARTPMAPAAEGGVQQRAFWCRQSPPSADATHPQVPTVPRPQRSTQRVRSGGGSGSERPVGAPIGTVAATAAPEGAITDANRKASRKTIPGFLTCRIAGDFAWVAEFRFA